MPRPVIYMQATTGGTTLRYTWDWANRMSASNQSGATTTYGYDHLGARVTMTVGSTTTIYPSKFYSLTITNGATSTASTYYVHPDHLGSTNAVTNASGAVVTTKDYYPYGSPRVTSGSASLKRGYITQFEDATGLDYLNARYYDSARGQFTSQDPVFWEVNWCQ